MQVLFDGDHVYQFQALQMAQQTLDQIEKDAIEKAEKNKKGMIRRMTEYISSLFDNNYSGNYTREVPANAKKESDKNSEKKVSEFRLS